MPPFNFLECRANRIYMVYIVTRKIAEVSSRGFDFKGDSKTADTTNTTKRGCKILTLTSAVSLHADQTHYGLPFVTALHRTCYAADPSSNLKACSHRSHPASTYCSLSLSLFPVSAEAVFTFTWIEASPRGGGGGGAMSDMAVYT